MIYLDVRGNLGNQLFEYACARQLQEKCHQKICLNIYDLKKNKPDYIFSLLDFKLNNLVIVEEKKPLPWLANIQFPSTKILKKVIPNSYFDILQKYGIYVWLNNKYKQINNVKCKDYYLVGYWQCERYFKNIKNIILDEFTPKQQLLPQNKELYNKITSKNSVCVTIRRGDYVSNEKFKKKFFICDKVYFYKAIKLLKEKISDMTLFIFSDDINWVKENMKFEGEVFYESGSDPVWEKLRLMSACKHFIISNSSFSWWAQYLSKNEGKIVIAPSSWYADGEQTDIYQSEWILINV